MTDAVPIKPVMDNFMFRLFFHDSPDTAEYVVNTILEDLGLPRLKLTRVEIEKRIPGLGREAVLDVFAEAGDQCHVDIEFQIRDKRDNEQRVRFYGALMDSSAMTKGSNFKEIPQKLIIFLCGFDPFRKRAGVYQVKKMVEYKGGTFSYNDGETIIFGNTTYREDDALGRLFSDLNETDPDKIYNASIADRMRYLTQTVPGEREMKESYDEYVIQREKEAAAKAAAQAAAQEAVKSFVSVINEMLKQGCDWDKIRSIAKVPDIALPEILKIFPEYEKA